MEQHVVSFIQCSCNQVHRLDGDRSQENTAYQQPFLLSSQHFRNMCWILRIPVDVLLFTDSQRGAETLNPCPAASRLLYESLLRLESSEASGAHHHHQEVTWKLANSIQRICQAPLLWLCISATGYGANCGKYSCTAQIQQAGTKIWTCMKGIIDTSRWILDSAVLKMCHVQINQRQRQPHATVQCFGDSERSHMLRQWRDVSARRFSPLSEKSERHSIRRWWVPTSLNSCLPLLSCSCRDSSILVNPHVKWLVDHRADYYWSKTCRTSTDLTEWLNRNFNWLASCYQLVLLAITPSISKYLLFFYFYNKFDHSSY
jgi:hypothetical protein